MFWWNDQFFNFGSPAHSYLHCVIDHLTEKRDTITPSLSELYAWQRILKTHYNSIVWRSIGTQIQSQTEFTRAGALNPFCSENKEFPETHLWWFFKGRCSQSQFKQRLCLKWHELYRGSERRFDLSLALHENSCTWETRCLTTTNSYTCIWQKSAPRITFLILLYLPIKTPNLFYIKVLLLALISGDTFVIAPLVSWEITTKWHK